VLTHNTNVAGDMTARLAAQLHERPKLAAVLAAYAQQFQDLEDALWSILTGRPYPVAAGDALTRWGAAVGEPRPTTGPAATDDSVYRPLVDARIATNISLGLTSDIMGLLRALQASQVHYAEYTPASVTLTVQDDIVASDATLQAMLVAATGPVRLDVEMVTDHPFGFASDPTAYGFSDGELARSVI
jgi:hypothetical protein